MTNLEKEQLLEEAKRRFPIGCKASNYNLGFGCTFLFRGKNFRFFGDDLLIDKNSVSSSNSNYTVYCKGDWAEVITYPKGYIPETNHNLILAL